MKHATLWLFALGMVAGLCVGCEKKKFTQTRFDTMIVNGQTKMEVEKILGEPKARWSDLWRWMDGEKSGAVKFDKNGLVIDKAWFDFDRQDPHPDSKWRKGDWPEGNKGSSTGKGDSSSSSVTVTK